MIFLNSPLYLREHSSSWAVQYATEGNQAKNTLPRASEYSADITGLAKLIHAGFDRVLVTITWSIGLTIVHGWEKDVLGETEVVQLFEEVCTKTNWKTPMSSINCYLLLTTMYIVPKNHWSYPIWLNRKKKNQSSSKLNCKSKKWIILIFKLSIKIQKMDPVKFSHFCVD